GVSAMNRVLLVALALVVPPRGVRAGETAVCLHVQPMPAPIPALKYQLLPELGELKSGNAAQGYLRCFAEQRNFFYSKEATTARARYLSMPRAELPVEKLRQYGRHALWQADWAARLDAADWQLVQHVQNDGLDVLLPGLGSLQILGAALQVRFRA